MPLATNDNGRLTSRQPTGAIRCIGDQDEHDDRPDRAREADQDEFPTPGREVRVDVADAEPKETAECNADAVAQVPLRKAALASRKVSLHDPRIQ